MTKKYYAFCKILDYGVIICWRLNPDLRLENYRSYIEDIWWFKGLKSSEHLERGNWCCKISKISNPNPSYLGIYATTKNLTLRRNWDDKIISYL
ncbi:hypothetical protein M747DRAFT_312512 [Aspergillus niger ATCC 13496]|uniref:Uncharacterized protein n=1 Tax=Aspergillus niger ATCC 13496 TaxID=1353008 RepID=A0A370CCX1_ASPNG|nr:hypothetical protein M747DRAFT_312512 [Aspergillus niger ATCC 13496]